MSNRIANTGEEWADLPKFDPRSTRRRKRPLLLGYTRRYIERHSDELGRPHPRIKKTIQTRLDARVIKGRTHWVRQASLASLREFDKALSEHSGDGGLTKYEVAAVAGIKPGTVDHRVRKGKLKPLNNGKRFPVVLDDRRRVKWCQKFAASDAAALKAERESRQAKRAARREAKPSAKPTRTDRHVAIDAAGVRRLTIAEFARRIGRAASWVRMVIGKPMPELGNDVLDAVDVVFPASRGRRVGVAQIGLRESHAVTLKLKLPSTKVRNWGRRGLGGQFVKLPPAVAANDQPAPVAPPAPRQTTPALPRPKTKAGRRAYAKSKVDTYRLLWAGWERAKGAGVKQAQYCLDAGTTVAALRKAYAYLLSHGEIQTT